MTNNNIEEDENIGIETEEHEAIFVLVPTSEAKDSFEARKLVDTIEEMKMLKNIKELMECK